MVAAVFFLNVSFLLYTAVYSRTLMIRHFYFVHIFRENASLYIAVSYDDLRNYFCFFKAQRLQSRQSSPGNGRLLFVVCHHYKSCTYKRPNFVLQFSSFHIIMSASASYIPSCFMPRPRALPTDAIDNLNNGKSGRFYLIQWSLSNMEKTGKLRKAVASCYAAYFSSSALHIISPAPILQKEMDFKLACCVPRTCSGLLKKLLSVARTQLKMIIFKGVCLFRFLLNAFNCYGILCCQGVAYGIFFFPVQIF